MFDVVFTSSIRDFWTGVKSVPLIESRIIFEEITYMQTIIRYELVIKALRSALMLDTPDEQSMSLFVFLENILDVIEFIFLKIIKRTCDR